MRKLILISALCFAAFASANTNNFTIKLDEFVLARSQTTLSDTIEMTREAWITSDSLHLTAYICGGNQFDKQCTFIARSASKLVIKKDFVNKHLAYQFSFATSSINPDKIRYLAMTIGANKNQNKMGWVYRMGIIKFIT